MPNRREMNILEDMLTLPTAPFTEDHVRDHILDFARQRKVRIKEDAVGNILLHYKHPAAKRSKPICLCAHMDHPGFRADRMHKGQLVAKWYGGVMPEYFPRAKVKFFSDGQWIKGQITKTVLSTAGLERPQRMVDEAFIKLNRKGQTVQSGTPGMWDFPDPQVRGQRIYARACDDLAGASAMMVCLDRLTRSKVKTEAYFLFTRAEEVGFIGAIAACRLKTIPKKCLVVAIETSSVLPGVEMGAGPVLRVGDKSSIFDPDLTAWCALIAQKLVRKDKKFQFQRKLMDGGSCESTAYCQLGYQATGLCIALGNYHNCDRVKKVLRPEFVDLNDFDNLAKWFVELAKCKDAPQAGDPQLRKRLAQLERRYSKLLRSTV